MSIALVVPSAALGSRMGSYGPRSLLDLGGRTVLARQIDLTLAALPAVSSCVVVAGEGIDRYRRRAGRDFGLVENPAPDATGAALSVSLGLRACSQPGALVVYGDLVFDAALLADFPTHRSAVLAVPADGFNRRDAGLTAGPRGDAAHFEYGLPKKWGQVAFLTGKELKLFLAVMADPLNAKMLGHEALNRVVTRGGSLFVHEAPGAALVEIDAPKDLVRAKAVK